jgi:hypothetical protein
MNDGFEISHGRELQPIKVMVTICDINNKQAA